MGAGAGGGAGPAGCSRDDALLPRTGLAVVAGEEAAFSPWWIGSDWQDRADRPDAVTGSISYQQACALVDSLPEGRHVFADRLANLLEWQGHEDTARYLRERYLLPEQDWDEPVAEKRDGSDPQETVSMSEPSRLNGASPFTPGPDAAPGPAGG